MESKVKLKQIDMSNRPRYYFDDIITYIYSVDILLDKKIWKYMKIFQFKALDKICGKIRHLLSEKLILKIALMIDLEKSELIYIIICVLKKYRLSIML